MKPALAFVIIFLTRAVLAQDEPADFPAWFSIMPPVVAIALAFWLRQVVPAMFAGIWVGAWALNGLTLDGMWSGFLESFQIFVVGGLADTDRASILLFTFMIGGMVGIVSRNGGMLGVVNAMVSLMHNRRRTQTGTAGLGFVVFFDDYANTLVVGNTMRPVTDRMRISREKLAYIVDSTAAPVTCLALVTTWIGYQVGLIDVAIADLDGVSNAYLVFLNSLAYSFYPVLALAFVFMVAATGRDFGPMHAVETRATEEGVEATPGYLVAGDDMKEAEPKPYIPCRAINALLPVLVVVGGVLAGIYVTGRSPEHTTVREIIGNSSSYTALLWGSLLGVAVAAVLTLSQRLLSIDETVTAWFAGVKSMFVGLTILVLSFALQDVTKEMGTANFVVQVIGDQLPAVILPALVFMIAAVTAFGTGTSWGTMGILMPLVIPLAWAIGNGDPVIFHSSVACILTGAVWGDHCSPISDTTVLSSTASGCQHIEHVKTQIPYALTVGAVALIIGTLGTSFGLPWWLAMIIGAGLLFTILRTFGTRVVGHKSADAVDMVSGVPSRADGNA